MVAVKACVDKANLLLFHMRSLKNLSIPSKLILVKAYIITTLTYPCIPLNTASLTCLYQLQTVQNNALRWVYNIRLRQMIPNRTLHLRANILPINQVIHARARIIWNNLRDGIAGDPETFERISSIEMRRYFHHFPSSLDIASKVNDPPPIYNQDDTRRRRTKRYYAYQLEDPLNKSWCR